jgi:hypothetical protein
LVEALVVRLVQTEVQAHIPVVEAVRAAPLVVQVILALGFLPLVVAHLAVAAAVQTKVLQLWVWVEQFALFGPVIRVCSLLLTLVRHKELDHVGKD